MEKKQTKKPAVKKIDFKKLNQSTKEVVFECSKDHKGLKKGNKYNVSENVAEILTAKGLGKVK